MKRVAIALVPLLVLLSGCASHPGDIVAEPISAREYDGLSCEGLEDALLKAKKDLAEASKRQMNKRTMDGVGNALLIPGLMSIAKDSREAVARHKGEVETLTRVMDQRCRAQEQ